MRNYDGIFEIRPSLIGTLSTISGTALGAPINVQGFRDVLGILVAGALAGSTGSTVFTTSKLTINELVSPRTELALVLESSIGSPDFMA